MRLAFTHRAYPPARRADERLPPARPPDNLSLQYFNNNLNQTTDSIIDQATLHELYVWPFAEAIRSGSGAFMCSCAFSFLALPLHASSLAPSDLRLLADNLLNSTSACENDALLNQLLKTEVSPVPPRAP